MKNQYLRYLCITTTLLLSFASSFAQQTKILTAEKHNEYGLVYTLPITAFRIEVVTVKEINKAGPFSNYAKIFTSDSKVISKDSETWFIESVKVTPYGIPNAEKQYLMQLKAGNVTYIGVAEDGMLLSINQEPELPVIENLSIVEIEGTPITGKEYLEFVNEDFISAQSSFKKSQLLAEELIEIRDAKLALTRGTADAMPTDGRQLEIMLESLDKQEKALVNAFTGTSWKERSISTFIFIPKEEGSHSICALNKKRGIVDMSDSKSTPVNIITKVIEKPELPVDTKGEVKKLPKDAVIYNIPGNVLLSINFDGQNLFEQTFQMSQFGIEFGLNPSIFSDKKEPSYATFDPTTGALKELGVVKQ